MGEMRQEKEEEDVPMTPMYVAAIMVEVVVLLALWAFGRHFAA
jgi:quinol-cytochrome oxidoreductase complex cytochrome b subunit